MLFSQILTQIVRKKRVFLRFRLPSGGKATIGNPPDNLLILMKFPCANNTCDLELKSRSLFFDAEGEKFESCSCYFHDIFEY